MNLLITLGNNIVSRISLLQKDYNGFNFDSSIIFGFFASIIFSALLLILFYSFGKKVSSPFKNNTENNYDYLFHIAIGYVITGTGVAILGLTSNLNFYLISLFLAIIAIYSFVLPFSLKKNTFELFRNFKKDILYLKTNKFVFVWIFLFLILGIIRLINPEVREDQYHIDLPAMYLDNQTIMIEPREQLAVSASPLLSEMIYAINILYLSKESTRYIHFMFYILVILTLLNFSRLKNYKFAIFTPIIFTSAPEVIRETSSMYVDFQWIFCFLLSVLILIDKDNNKFAIAKSGFLLGGMIATKLWTIVFSIVPAIYILISKDSSRLKIRYLATYSLFALVPTFLWFFRATILTGSPLYPALKSEQGVNSSFIDLISRFIGINYELINIFSYTNVFSPIFFISFAFLIFNFKKFIKVAKLPLFKYIGLLLVLYLSIHYPFGRYLLGLYVLFIFINSFLIYESYKYFPVKIILNLLLMVLYSYYFINSVLVLPYAFGFADKNAYLSRILIRDASSYYDYGRKFGHRISQHDKVAMYGFNGYYYADFKYSDVRFIFETDERSLKFLKEKGYTKLLLRFADLDKFCKDMKLSDCKNEKINLISSHPEFPGFYLYNLN